MDSVSEQPQRVTAGRAGASARLSTILKTRTGRGEDESPTSRPSSPVTASLSPRLGGSRAAGRRSEDESFYIPYHGPISPRPGDSQFLPQPHVGQSFASAVREAGYGSLGAGRGRAGSFGARESTRLRSGSVGRRRSSSGALHPQPGEELKGLGLSTSGSNQAEFASRPPSSSSSSDLGQLAGSPSVEERFGRLYSSGGGGGASPYTGLGFGLPTAYIHGGNTPRLDHSPQASTIPTLPSAMRTPTGADLESSMLRDSHSPTSFWPRSLAYGRPTPSVASRPTAHVFPSPGTRERSSGGRGRASSLSSVDAGSAEDTSASALGERSASTSMTSLRQSATTTPAKPTSSYGGSVRRPAGSRASHETSSRGSTRSRRARAASSVPDLRLRDDHAGELDRFANSPETDRSPDDGRSPVDGLSPSEELPPRLPIPSFGGDGSLRHLRLVPDASKLTPPSHSLNPDAPLSPIAQSSSAGSTRPAFDGTPNMLGSTPNMALAMAAQGTPSNVRPPSALSAGRNYRALQRLHLQELAAHDPDTSGWHDAASGCERVFMPRPRLKRRESSDESQLSQRRQSLLTALSLDPGHGRRLPRSESVPDLNRGMGAAAPPVPERDGSRRTVEHAAAARFETLERAPGSGSMRARLEGRSSVFHHRLPPGPPVDKPVPVLPHLTTTPPTPGLSPGLGSEASEEQGTPDLDVDTVLAQGRALEEQRQRWREEFLGSLEGGRLGYRKPKSGGSRERAHSGAATRSKRRIVTDVSQWKISDPMPADDDGVRTFADEHDRAGLRPSKSTPQLRPKQSHPKTAEQLERARAEAGSPDVPTSCRPLWLRTSASASYTDVTTVGFTDGGTQLLVQHARSKSDEAATSAVLASGPKSTRSSRWSTLRRNRDSDSGQTPPATTGSNPRLRASGTFDKAAAPEAAAVRLSVGRGRTPPLVGRATPLPMDELRNSVPGLNKSTLVTDQPVIIGEASASQRESFSFPRRGSSSLKRIPPPRFDEAGEKDQFGVAFSSPRPDLTVAGAQATKEAAPPSQGRHATSASYHRPSNSADLRALIAANQPAASSSGHGSDEWSEVASVYLTAAAQARASTVKVSSRRSGNSFRHSDVRTHMVRTASGRLTPPAPKRSSSLSRHATAIPGKRSPTGGKKSPVGGKKSPSGKRYSPVGKGVAASAPPSEPLPPLPTSTSAAIKRDSVGMTLAAQSLAAAAEAERIASANTSPAFTSRQPLPPPPSSLPAPPRRNRSASASSSGAGHRRTTTSSERRGAATPGSGRGITPPVPFETPFSDAGRFDFGGQSERDSPAFYTPQGSLTNLDPARSRSAVSHYTTDDGGVEDDDDDGGHSDGEQGQASEELLEHAQQSSGEGEPVQRSLSARSARTDASSPSAGRMPPAPRASRLHSKSSDSSLSQRSFPTREVWTTDDREEGSFNELFVRRPDAPMDMPTTPRNDTFDEDEQRASSGVVAPSYEGDVILTPSPESSQDEDPLETPRPVPRPRLGRLPSDGVYRDALRARRDSDTVSGLVRPFVESAAASGMVASPTFGVMPSVASSSLTGSSTDSNATMTRLGRVNRTPSLVSKQSTVRGARRDDSPSSFEAEIQGRESPEVLREPSSSSSVGGAPGHVGGRPSQDSNSSGLERLMRPGAWPTPPEA